MNETPVARGLIVCEKAIIEEGSQRVTLVNCFNRELVDSLPREVSFCVLASLTNGFGDVALSLVIYRLDTYEEVYRRSDVVFFPNQLEDMRYLVRIGFTFAVSTTYEVELLAGSEQIAVTRFSVRLREDAGHG